MTKNLQTANPIVASLTSTDADPSDTLRIPAQGFDDIELDGAALYGAPSGVPVAPNAAKPEVSDRALKLIAEEREIATAFGAKHDANELFYAEGTALWGIGLDAAKALAAKYASLPSIADAAQAHSLTIEGEQRRVRPFVPSEWRIDRQGFLTTSTSDITVQATLTASAWSQLCTLQSVIASDATPAFRQANQQALDLPSGNVNGWIHLAKAPRNARVRTMSDTPQIFALVSSGSRGYTICDGPDILQMLAKVLPDTRCELKYDMDSTRLRARVYVQTACDIPAFTRVGRVHKAGVQLTTRDDGMGSIEMRLFLERIRCKNHSLTCESFGMVRRKHTGKYEALVHQLHTLASKMDQMIDQMRSLWARAAAEYYLDSETGAQLSAPEAIARLVVHGHIPTGGLSTDEATDAYVRAWRAEECPHSAAGVVMAIQRAAHEGPWTSRWAEDTAVETASNLLHARVLTLDAPELDA